MLHVRSLVVFCPKSRGEGDIQRNRDSSWIFAPQVLSTPEPNILPHRAVMSRIWDATTLACIRLEAQSGIDGRCHPNMENRTGETPEACSTLDKNENIGRLWSSFNLMINYGLFQLSVLQACHSWHDLLRPEFPAQNTPVVLPMSQISLSTCTPAIGLIYLEETLATSIDVSDLLRGTKFFS
ncbi:hypothetical protein DFH09DRAFT_155237 [Mycena vulgaris]|nr:hypothetical protein DFH09DRAFT_155237 [Mycena vulgaris]